MSIQLKSPEKTEAYAVNLMRFIKTAEELGLDFSLERSTYPRTGVTGWSVTLDGIVMVDDETGETVYSTSVEEALELALPIIDTVTEGVTP